MGERPALFTKSAALRKNAALQLRAARRATSPEDKEMRLQTAQGLKYLAAWLDDEESKPKLH
jgi:hypothetical protein